jgi:hypothetical protein
LFDRLSKIATTVDELHKALYDLNEEAFCQRYPGNDGERTRYPENIGFKGFTNQEYNQITVYPHPIDREALIPAYKATKCLLYQCSEGDVEETPLFKALEAFCTALAKDYSESSTGYLAAKWG